MIVAADPTLDTTEDRAVCPPIYLQFSSASTRRVDVPLRAYARGALRSWKHWAPEQGRMQNGLQLSRKVLPLGEANYRIAFRDNMSLHMAHYEKKSRQALHPKQAWRANVKGHVPRAACGASVRRMFCRRQARWA